MNKPSIEDDNPIMGPGGVSGFGGGQIGGGLSRSPAKATLVVDLDPKKTLWRLFLLLR